MRKLGPADYRHMPWKNGGGSTTELRIEPPGATLAGGFRWRLSMAAVPESGPFSAFPGLDRTLLLLSGRGMELDHGPHGRALLAGPLEPVRFPGEWATFGRLVDGPCVDFNVMSARGQVRHEVAILRPGTVPSSLPEAYTVLVYDSTGALVGKGSTPVIPAFQALSNGYLGQAGTYGALLKNIISTPLPSGVFKILVDGGSEYSAVTALQFTGASATALQVAYDSAPSSTAMTTASAQASASRARAARVESLPKPVFRALQR